MVLSWHLNTVVFKYFAPKHGVQDIHLLAQPTFACRFPILGKPSDCLAQKEKIKIIIQDS
jgi:hypothetical protein